MNRRLPLSALLSQALVAFTIEFDKEFEHRAPHRNRRTMAQQLDHTPPPGSCRWPCGLDSCDSFPRTESQFRI